jgi:hypothetical protein
MRFRRASRGSPVKGMALGPKVKTALDETRTLMLGAQILLGFQLQGAFQPVFDELPRQARMNFAFTLGLMLLTVGLLIAPSAFHRIAEHGESTGRLQFWAGRCAEAALAPFAVALALDLGTTLGRSFGNSWAGAATGVGFALAALAAWYGWGKLMKAWHGAAERRQAAAERGSRETSPLHMRIEQMLVEARVILPGAQALMGFQLIIVLSDTFENLPSSSQLLHGLALLCVASSTILLITPAALHRIVWAGEDSEALLRIGGRITAAALAPLALGLTGDAYVVFARILHAPVLALAVSGLGLLFLVGLWFIWPLALRTPRETDRT